MLVIETNISYDNLGDFCDHQSRVIEVESWEKYIESYTNNSPKKFNGTMCGYNFFNNYKMSGLQYDEYHLCCDFDNGTKKLAYRLQDEFELKLNKN